VNAETMLERQQPSIEPQQEQSDPDATAATDGGDRDDGRDRDAQDDDAADDDIDPNMKSHLQQAFKRESTGSGGVASKDDLMAHLSRWYDAETAADVIRLAVERKDWLTERTEGEYTSPVFG
jgi:hypothetical protein